MKVKELLKVSTELKIKLRTVKNRKVVSNIIENRGTTALIALSDYYLNKEVINIYIDDGGMDKGFMGRTLIINIEE